MEYNDTESFLYNINGLKSISDILLTVNKNEKNKILNAINNYLNFGYEKDLISAGIYQTMLYFIILGRKLLN